jgi:hypothetical protein
MLASLAPRADAMLASLAPRADARGGSRFKVQGSRFKVLGSGFWVRSGAELSEVASAKCKQRPVFGAFRRLESWRHDACLPPQSRSALAAAENRGLRTNQQPDGIAKVGQHSFDGNSCGQFEILPHSPRLHHHSPKGPHRTGSGAYLEGMTLAATRRYAFGASVLLGLAAAVVAAVLISMLLSDPERVVIAMSDAELGSLLRLVFSRILDAARAVVKLL